MRALVCERPGEVALRNIPVPVPGPGEVVVRVKAALTCGTDLKQILRGHPKVPFPVILGHELAGTVESVGEGVVDLLAGERVTCAVSGPCGFCGACRTGDENLCPSAFDGTVWGAFAEFVLVPPRVVERGLYRLPEGLSFEAAALLDPLASVVRGVSRLPIPEGCRALLHGSGPIALMFATLLSRRGVSNVVVSGRNPDRLRRFAALGFETSPSADDRFDVVVDTTGAESVAEKALFQVRTGGALMLFAGMPKGSRVRLDAGRIHYDEVTVIGSFHYTPREAREALDLLVSGAVPVDVLVDRTSALEGFHEVFERMRASVGMKTAFQP